MLLGGKKQTSDIKWVKILSKVDIHIEAPKLKIQVQKQPSIGVLSKRCFESMQQI